MPDVAFDTGKMVSTMIESDYLGFPSLLRRVYGYIQGLFDLWLTIFQRIKTEPVMCSTEQGEKTSLNLINRLRTFNCRGYNQSYWNSTSVWWITRQSFWKSCGPLTND
jgi:hypothetical protein